MDNFNEEVTTSGDIAQPDAMMHGKPIFRVHNDLFNKIGFTCRKFRHRYMKNYEDPRIVEFCKTNKGKSYYIQDEKTGWILEVERDRYNWRK